MMKWSPWMAAGGTKKLHVKVNKMKLELLSKEKVEYDDKIVMAEIKWRGPKSGVLVPFYRTSTYQRNYTTQRWLRQGQPVEWDEEFESVCNFSVSKDGSFGPWNLTFNVLYGESRESRTKSAVMAKASLNLAELASKMETRIERKLPITLHDGRNLAREATLSVSVSFVEVRDSNDSPSPRIGLNSAESDTENTLLTKVKELTRLNKKKHKPEVSSCDSEEFTVFNWEGSTESVTTSGNRGFTSANDFDSVLKRDFFSWKRRRLSFRQGKGRVEPLTSGPLRKGDVSRFSSGLDTKDDNCSTSNWEVKELLSRDGQAKLKTNAFFASFDQRSEKASGESACTALVTVIAHWLHSTQAMPTRPEFDSLIIEGSSEWQKLCSNETYIKSFPDKHFDLDTVLEANLRPLSVVPEKSFVGFFCPEKFECLKEAMSFNEIWNKINSNTENDEPSVYIVSWNDHFFVLKVEADAYYIIDSLGERLSEGCNQAYILKFDDSSLMYERAEKERFGYKEKSEEIICSGKECCKEFINRFLAAISLRELEEEKEKGRVSNNLHQRLQIEFHLCSSPYHHSSSTYHLFSSEWFM